MTKIRRTPRPTPKKDTAPEPVAVKAEAGTAEAVQARAVKPVAPQGPPRPEGRKPGRATHGANPPGNAGKGKGNAPTPRRKPGAAESEFRPSSTLRLFYALKVPVEIAGPFADAQKKLRGNWRAVRPDQMHVTLAYLPSVPPSKLPDLKRLGTRLTEHLPPMRVKLRGTGYFPNEGSPRVWFVKVEADGLTELAADLRAGLHALGLDTEEQPFKAHITLARKKGPAPRVPPLLFDTGWQAGSAALYRSILRKTGPIYELESTFRFRGTPSTPDPATTPGTEKTLTEPVTQETP